MTKAKYFFVLLGILGTVIFSPIIATTAQETPVNGAGSPATTRDTPPASERQPTPTETIPIAPEATPSPSAPSNATTPEATPSPSAPSNATTPEVTPGSGNTATTELKGDYSLLQTYLQEHKLKEADQETFAVMLKVAGTNSETQGRFDIADWQNFSCPDLKKIDSLWSEASGGKLGFSAQKRVLEQTRRNYYIFYAKIGWFDLLTKVWRLAWKYDPTTKTVNYVEGKSPDFVNPPEGHLPAKLEWVTAEGQEPQDRRFEKMYGTYACPEFASHSSP
jgi:GUN4-like